MAKKQYSPETIATVRQLVPIDDIMFQKICESKAVCQEIISTILEEKVNVIEVIPQDTLANLQGRSVRLDCLCRLQSGAYVNVEVQKTDDDDHEARVRYNASVITANQTPKGTRFKDVAQVIVIYITRFDIFAEGLPIYHIDRIVRETGKCRADGFKEIYVNAAVKNYDNSLNRDVSDLMDLFTQRDVYYPEKFPKLSSRKEQFTNTEGGAAQMCEKVEQLFQKRERESLLNLLFEGVQDGGIRPTYAAKKANLSLNEFKQEMRMHGYTVPERRRRSGDNAN